MTFFDGIVEILQEGILSITNSLPESYRAYVILAIYTLIIAIYSIFVWKFYRFLAKRDLLELNLKRYNHSEHPGLKKFFTSLFYLLEYLIILPIIVFLWFSILAVFILLLSENQAIEHILLISASVVASVRLTAYFSEDLSKDLAKIFPFTILVVFLLNPDSFSITTIIQSIGEIPQLMGNILAYLIFIIGLEAIMRLIFLIIYSTGPPEEKPVVEGIVESDE